MPAHPERVTSFAGPRPTRAREELQTSEENTGNLHTDQSAEFGGDDNAVSSWTNEPYRPRMWDALSLPDDASKWLASDAEQDTWSAYTAPSIEEWTHENLPLGMRGFSNRVRGFVSGARIAAVCGERAESSLRRGKRIGLYDMIKRMQDLERHLADRGHYFPWHSIMGAGKFAVNPGGYGNNAEEFERSPAMQEIVTRIARFNELVEAWDESAELLMRISVQREKHSELKRRVKLLEMTKAIREYCRSLDSKKLKKQEEKIEELQKELQNTQRERDQVQKNFDKFVGDMTRSLNEVKKGWEQEENW